MLIDDGGGTGQLAAGEVNAASSAVSAIRQISIHCRNLVVMIGTWVGLTGSGDDKAVAAAAHDLTGSIFAAFFFVCFP